MTEELNRFQRIKSLLQDTKLIDSHTISLVVAECDMALTQRPAAQAGEVELAFDQGWRMAAEWANRDDLIPDMDSPHYAKERSDRLASLPTQPAAQAEREANATARAFSLATMAAEEFVRCNGLSTGEADEFMMTGPDLTDEHATACVDHLKWVGECVAFDTDDGVLVRLGDFTLGSLS